jgi:hypothetical protein
MSLTATEWDELVGLLDAVCREEHDPAQTQRLQALVNDSPESRDLFSHTLQLHAALQWHFRDETSSTDVSTAARQRALPVLRFFGSITSALNRPIIASVLIVAICFYGLFTVIAWNLQPDTLAKRPQSAFTDTTIEAPWAPGQIAKLIAAHDCHWKGLDKPPVEQEALQQGPLELVSGTAQVAFADGAQVTITGPTHFESLSASHLKLHGGQVLARVPHEAIGFTVTTPTATVVDLGTEFGVEVDSAGETSVQVLEGIVEFSSNPKGFGDADSRLIKRRLQKGEAARTDLTASGIVAAEFKPDRFFRRPSRSATTSQPARLISLTTATATQSSEFDNDPYPANQAIDGESKTFSHTSANDSASWWQLDLGRSQPITAIVLHNRDKGLGWLRDITVKVIAEDGKTIVAASPKLNPRNGLIGDEFDFDRGPARLVFNVPRIHDQPVAGRFVRVEREPCSIEESRMKTKYSHAPWMSSCRGTLVLSEVEVFGLAVNSESPLPTGNQR